MEVLNTVVFNSFKLDELIYDILSTSWKEFIVNEMTMIMAAYFLL